MANKRKRRTFEQQSILVWIQRDEKFIDAQHRLNREWGAGVHPTQKVKDDDSK